MRVSSSILLLNSRLTFRVWVADLLRHGLQGGGLPGAGQTRQDDEPEILARRLLDRLFNLVTKSAMTLHFLGVARSTVARDFSLTHPFTCPRYASLLQTVNDVSEVHLV